MSDARATPRWAWAFGIATVLAALVWYLGRADTLALQRGAAPWFTVTGRALPAATAFTLTFVAFGLAPAMLAHAVLGQPFRALGLGLGDYRFALKALAIGAPVAVAAGWVGARSPAMAAVYPLGGPLGTDPAAFAAHAGLYLLYYLGFEYLFRGFLLLGTKDAVGPAAANLLQACLVTAFHFGKPGMEMAAAFPASLLFGWATLRTGSIWCALAAHWVVGASMDYFLVFGR
ncbi:MAG: CPBP family intramembrane metalloprotease [Gemmatimonadetes bacterium]|nr:CPBP family intramembrane metalloprotease [Gemmatimonadota bacterium]